MKGGGGTTRSFSTVVTLLVFMVLVPMAQTSVSGYLFVQNGTATSGLGFAPTASVSRDDGQRFNRDRRISRLSLFTRKS